MDEIRSHTDGETRLRLYPMLEPYRRGWLAMPHGHEIYFEECGNPDGVPALIVHGGPGGGSNPIMRRYHDPERYRIVLFDQRGCGLSRPHASLERNTTSDLVADIERLRKHLGIERWQLFGGSWGSTLSLIYAEAHPDRVSSLILRGIFLLRRAEIDWFYQEGCGWLYPQEFDAFRAPIPQSERSDMVAAYYRRLTHADRRVQLEAARAWSLWEGSTLSLIPSPDRRRVFTADSYALAFARIECHYFVHGGFLGDDNQILADIGRIAHIPGLIVHGRYDVVTPLKSAWDLKQGWPGAELRIVADAGHAMTEPGIVHELVRATRGLVDAA